MCGGEETYELLAKLIQLHHNPFQQGIVRQDYSGSYAAWFQAVVD
jgi:hypothetical protein